MKQLVSFIQKEFYHIVRDRTTMLILLVIPIIQMIMFGFALSTEVKNTHIAVLMPTHDVVAENITNRLDNSVYFDVTERLSKEDQIQTAFKSGNVKLVVVFEENFAERLQHEGKAHVQLIADATDPNAATTFSFYASTIIKQYQQDSMGAARNPYQITPEVKMLYNPQMISAYNFVPGVLGLILILVCAMMTSIAIVREKEIGTMEVLLVSPMKPIYSLLSKITPYFVLSCINFISIILLSLFVLKVPIEGSYVALVLISLIYIFVSLALGLLISTVANTQLAAMMISGMGLMMPVLLLSGMIFPIESMPYWLQIVSNIIPTRWYIEAVKSIMIQGLGFAAVWKEMLILTTMAMFFIVVSLKMFKIRLE